MILCFHLGKRKKTLEYIDIDSIFFERVSTSAWYQSMDLRDICSDEIIPRRPLLIYSVKDFDDENLSL